MAQRRICVTEGARGTLLAQVMEDEPPPGWSIPMKNPNMVPLYSADGQSLGFRSLDAAKRLLAEGHVRASYGRRRNLTAIWLPGEAGGNPVAGSPPLGTRYSYLEKLKAGNCWTLRRLEARDQAGNPVSMRPDYLRVVADCLRT